MKVIETIVNKKSAVFVFDEIDKVEDFDFMYNLLEDIYKKAVILITNYKEWMVGLDERIKSRLTPESLEFKQYTLAETKDILNRRLEAAFHEGIWEDDAFEAVVQKTAGLKDIRTGIYLLREAAMHAEDRSSKKINIDDVQAAFAKMDDFTIKKSTELESETQQILKIVRENSGKKIGDLYKVYQDQGGEASYKTFQRKITSLEKNKFVSLTKSTGAGGNTTIVEKKLTEF